MSETEENKQEMMIDRTNAAEIKNDAGIFINLKGFFLWLISKGLPLISLVTAVLTATGFVVVQNYMASFSTLFSYNVSLSLYLSAGSNFILDPIFNLIMPLIFEAMKIALPIVLVLLLVIIVYEIVIFFNKDVSVLIEKPNNWIEKYKHIFKIFYNLYMITVFIAFIILIISRLYNHGGVYYEQNPRALGGGQPATVILTFNDEQPLNLWNFAINPEQPRLSEPLQLLIELNDGILVRQAEGYPAVIVKNHIIDAIQDASIPMPESEN